MLPPKMILLPVDFSERMLGAAHYARTIACHFQSELTLLHVLPLFRYEFYGMESTPALNSLFETRSEDAKRELDSYLAEDLGDVNVKRVVLDGDPATQIIEYARSNGTDLIVMPTAGYGPFRRFILGSVTAKVLHDAECPVLTGVHMEESLVQPIYIRRIVCAVDLGPNSRKVLSYAAKLADNFGAKLAVMHVTPSLESRARTFDPSWRLALARHAEEQIAELQKDMPTQGEIWIDDGEIPRIVAEAVKTHNADLLVIGRGEAEGVLGRLRANAYAILRESPCPVISV